MNKLPCRDYCDVHHANMEWRDRATEDIRNNCASINKLKERFAEVNQVQWEQGQQKQALEHLHTKLDTAVDKLDLAIKDLSNAIKTDYVPAARFIWVERICYAMAVLVITRTLLKMVGVDV
jgi:predicted nuclease with TOPRIM domain